MHRISAKRAGGRLLLRHGSSASRKQGLRSFPEKRMGLYDPKLEKDSCGVGLCVQLKSIASRNIVEDANEMLVRMTHRGACGCEENTGDGAGMMVAIPDAFMRKVSLEAGISKLPEQGDYAVGNIFVPKFAEAISEGKAILERVVKARGMKVLGWRMVPFDNSMIGATALSTEPHILQVFVGNAKGLPNWDFERELFRVRKQATAEADAVPVLNVSDTQSFYVSSLSSRTITYKGQLSPEQVMPYYLDLQQPDFQSHLALVHSRFSTNTFPSWNRAQPNRMMCHNGEINTLRGNKNWMYARAGMMHSEFFGDDTHQLLPCCSDNMSDSGNFDSVLETMVKGGEREIPEVMMAMVPEAWQDNMFLSDTKSAFYEYNSAIMEPWDGPAMMAFTDGRYIGATLDRNGLRPSRYYVTEDDRVLLSSEVGVLPDLPEDMVKLKSRLEPGKMFLVDLKKGEIVPDDVVKEDYSTRRPYKDWIDANMLSLTKWAREKVTKYKVPLYNFEDSNRRFNMFGYTAETMDMLLMPMAIGGREGLGSMGNDAPLAVLSEKPRLLFDYFKQLFAQVTNPPIDPIREEMVMSLVCPVGPEQNLLDVTPQHCARLVVDNPILTRGEMQALKDTTYMGWRSYVIDTTFPAGSGPEGLSHALDQICAEAADALQGGNLQVLVLSDKLAGPDRMPVPSLLALGAVHQHLLASKQRLRAALFVECGDAREVHDMCTLIGFGADGVCPWVGYEAIAKMNHDGLVEAKAKQKFANEELFKTYRKSLSKGMLKVMSKMGISTLQSYKGAQVFEAVGLADELVDRCFTGTTSRLQGTGMSSLYQDIARMHVAAYPPHSNSQPLLDNLGEYHFRDGGEAHLNNPETMVYLQMAARNNSRESYKAYSEAITRANQKVTLRGLLKFNVDPAASIPIDEVESVQAIMKRFNTGAMSLGSISRETHETLAQAVNHIGGRSNTGEGGEDSERFKDNRRSAIKQVASGRFGVTSNYLANSDQIQIKMAQGAKPGEGGELPGSKVTKYIAFNRHTTPGVGLISPPPHHDIYSIEDLAQLIHDLKNANPEGEVSVKLVSEVGVGVVAAGVAKAKADHITVSGHDGGTGAAVWTAIKGAGLPWELGVAEAQQTLVLNDLRSRVRLQTDGQLKNGRDVVVAALLGAEEYAFSTAPLIAMGCIMMRKCHLNTCPVGVATQDPDLRRKFTGKPEHVVNYFYFMAEEIREIMAELGFRTMEEMVGRVDKLEVNEDVLHYKSQGLDLSPLLTPATSLNENNSGVFKTMEQDHGIQERIDLKIVEAAKAAGALDGKGTLEMELPITNLDRTTGTILSYNISKLHGEAGLPDDSIRLKFNGHAGQSFGFALAKGVSMTVEGDANDYVGKGLSGGKIVVYPTQSLQDKGFCAEDNVIVGNTCMYGATSGKAFLRGKAGERFCVRNSGALAVVEGVGDHGCEYMTGGKMVCLGSTGRNFAAGMSGGIAYVYDPNGLFPDRCNRGMVALQSVDSAKEVEELRSYLAEHVETTSSPVAQKMLSNWDAEVKHFVKVMPHDYARVLAENDKLRAQGIDPDVMDADAQSFAAGDADLPTAAVA
jgi:glutamate synthase (NADPH/NADH)